MRQEPGQPEQLELEREHERVEAGPRSSRWLVLVERVEEARQREERTLVALLLREQAQHRLEADEPDLKPRSGRSGSGRASGRATRRSRSRALRARDGGRARRARTARDGRRSGSSSGARPSRSRRACRSRPCRRGAPGPPPRTGTSAARPPRRSTVLPWTECTSRAGRGPDAAHGHEAALANTVLLGARAPLAVRAEPRAAAGDDDPLDRTPATVARLAEPAVDVELVLHRAPVPVRRDVVAKRRPLPLDPLPQNRSQRAVQPRQLGPVELSRGAERMELCAPERLVGVDVPDARDAPLVEEEGLDGGRPTRGRGGEPGGGK